MMIQALAKRSEEFPAGSEEFTKRSEEFTKRSEEFTKRSEAGWYEMGHLDGFLYHAIGKIHAMNQFFR